MDRTLTKLAALLVCLSGACSPPEDGGQDPEAWTYARVYSGGNGWSYELTTTVWHDGVFEKREVGLSNHEVLADAAGEQVRWTSLTVEAPEGTFTDESEAAQSVPPYEMSLATSDEMVMPDLVVPEMTGMITDLFTYYVAVSSSLGVTEVHEPGDVYTGGEPVVGDWSDDLGTPVGQDCIVPSIELVDLDEARDLARFETRFEVPDTPDCLEWVHESWSTPVVDGQMNNFQQVVDVEGDMFAMYGVEWFTIRTDVDASDGRILEATMDNRLDLQLLGGCDAEWQNCGYVGQLVIERQEQLALP